MIRRGFLVFAMMTSVLLSGYGQGITEADMKDPAGMMAKFDYNHSKAQFQSLLNVLHSYYPEVSMEDLGFYIVSIWGKTKETLPDLSLYNFVYGLKNFARDSGISNFSDMLAAYSASKMSGY